MVYQSSEDGDRSSERIRLEFVGQSTKKKKGKDTLRASEICRKLPRVFGLILHMYERKLLEARG